MDGVQEVDSRSQIFWTSEMSVVALKFLARLVADGVRVDKGFKNSHYNQCAKAVSQEFGFPVSGGQIINHLKTWRTRWTNISRMKKISSAHFDEETGTIILDQKNYLDRIQKKPSEAKYFNKPLENYHYMAVIFGNQQATGMFAKGTSDALASDAPESATETNSFASTDLGGSESNNTSPVRDGGETSSRGGSGRKRARVTVEDDDPMVTSVTEVFREMTSAIKQIAPPPPPAIPPNLYEVMMGIPVFEEGDLAHYYAYLCERPALANAFMGLKLDHKIVWVARYIKEHLSG